MNTNKKFCSHCGKQIVENTKFCPHCGKNPFAPQISNNISYQSPKIASSLKYLLIALAFVGLFGGAFLFKDFIINKKDNLFKSTNNQQTQVQKIKTDKPNTQKIKYRAKEDTDMFGYKLREQVYDIEQKLSEITGRKNNIQKVFGNMTTENIGNGLLMAQFNNNNNNNGIFFTVMYPHPQGLRWKGAGIVVLATNYPEYYTEKGVSIGSSIQDIERAYEEFKITHERDNDGILSIRVRIAKFRIGWLGDIVFIMDKDNRVGQIILTAMDE